MANDSKTKALNAKANKDKIARAAGINNFDLTSSTVKGMRKGEGKDYFHKLLTDKMRKGAQSLKGLSKK